LESSEKQTVRVISLLCTKKYASLNGLIQKIDHAEAEENEWGSTQVVRE
jgi:hypothetical protein